MQEAKECLQDALEVHKEEGGTVEPGAYEAGCPLLDLIYGSGYAVAKDMAMIVRPWPDDLHGVLTVDFQRSFWNHVNSAHGSRRIFVFKSET